MSIEAIRKVIASEPASLGELESALGFSLARDAKGDEAFFVRRKNPAPGIEFVYAAFIGGDLRGESDPRIDELRISTSGIDCGAQALALLGPEEKRAVPVSWDPFHQPPPAFDAKPEIAHFGWGRAHGRLTLGGPDWLFWLRHEAPFAKTWSSSEETLSLSRLWGLLQEELDLDRIERAFGKLTATGRTSERFVRGPNWRVVVKPIDLRPTSFEAQFKPSLPLDRVLSGLGFSGMLVSTRGVHQSSAHVIDSTTREEPKVEGRRVEIEVESTSGGIPSAVKVPAQRVYETTNLLATCIRLSG